MFSDRMLGYKARPTIPTRGVIFSEFSLKISNLKIEIVTSTEQPDRQLFKHFRLQHRFLLIVLARTIKGRHWLWLGFPVMMVSNGLCGIGSTKQLKWWNNT
jgi:hypothetical protein